MDLRLYFYIEDLNLTAQQRDALLSTLHSYGRRNSDRNPCHRNHWRTRLDNRAAIFEGWFEDTQLAVAHFQSVLAGIYGVPAANITFTTTTNAYGSLATFAHAGQDRLRLGVFGALSATYLQSRAAALAYLTANRAAWEA